MLHYTKLPKSTPKWLANALLWLGGAIGIGLMLEVYNAIYGLMAYFMPLFFPSAGFSISTDEGLALGLMGGLATLTIVLIIMMAMDMNSFRHKAALLKSEIVIAMGVLTACAVLVGYATPSLKYGFSGWNVTFAIATIVFAGVLPYLVLKTKAAQKIRPLKG